jgi:hypothetical protein
MHNALYADNAYSSALHLLLCSPLDLDQLLKVGIDRYEQEQHSRYRYAHEKTDDNSGQRTDTARRLRANKQAC